MHSLIIEDEAYTAEVLRFALASVGFTSCDIASSEVEAIDAAAARRPDLVCADVTLNEGSGIAAVEKICSGHDCATLFVTASPMRVRLALPGSVIVQKPFSLKQVHWAVGKARENAKGKA